MSSITKKNRYESYLKTQEDSGTLYEKIVEVLKHNKEMSAREIALKIGLERRQDVQPRLNELRDRYKIITEAGEKKDEITNRTVTTYRIATEGEKWAMANEKHISGY